MAETTNTPTRRAMLASITAASVAGFPALAGAISTPLSLAIERHKAARAAVHGYEGEDDDHMAGLVRENFAAAEALARTPCASDAEVLRKLAHLFEFDCELWGGRPDMAEHFGSVAIALATHFDGEGAQ